MQSGHEIFFLDEAGFILMDYSTYGWYKKGSRPVKSISFSNKSRRTIVGALSTRGFVIAEQHRTIDSETYLGFLTRLKERFPKMMIVMDNVSLHYTKKLRDWYEANHVKIVKLPKYSPQLNPIEQLWKNIKQWLGTIQPLTKSSLIRALDQAIEKTELWPKSYGY